MALRSVGGINRASRPDSGVRVTEAMSAQAHPSRLQPVRGDAHALPWPDFSSDHGWPLIADEHGRATAAGTLPALCSKLQVVEPALVAFGDQSGGNG